MVDSVRRLLIFAVVAGVCTYGVLFVGGNIVEANAARVTIPLVVRDTPEKGAHILSGSLVLPISCDQLSAHIAAISTSTFIIVLTTWQEPSIPCTQTKVSKWFQAVAFAPRKGISFSAKLDGDDVPMVIENVAEGQ